MEKQQLDEPAVQPKKKPKSPKLTGNYMFDADDLAMLNRSIDVEEDSVGKHSSQFEKVVEELPFAGAKLSLFAPSIDCQL